MMTPEPRPGWWNSSRRPGPRGPKNWSKKSLRSGSSAKGPGATGGRRRLAICTGLIWTTAGRTYSATLANSEKRQCFLISIWCRGRPMKAGSLRRLVSLLLVVSLLAPGPGFAQIPTTPQQPQPPAPAMRSTPTPPPALLGPRGVTPGPDYRLAPGDLLDVQIAGRLEVIRQQAVVDLEGAINVPPLGAIPVAGLTLLEAHRKVAARARA